MSEELEVLKEVVRRLDETAIAYMITGSTAANFYAVPRMTRDIDIVVELSDRDTGKFILAFEKDHYLEPETVRDAVKNKGMFNLIHDEYVIKVDFVVRKDTSYRRREFSRKKKISVDGQDLYVVAPEDLILSKLEWAKESKSEVQLKDVKNLLQSVKQLNRRYLTRWAKQLGVDSLYREVSQFKIQPMQWSANIETGS
jgi:predicted nucleotidyltransferase